MGKISVLRHFKASSKGCFPCSSHFAKMSKEFRKTLKFWWLNDDRAICGARLIYEAQIIHEGEKEVSEFYLPESVTVVKDIMIIKLQRGCFDLTRWIFSSTFDAPFPRNKICHLCLCYLDHGHVFLGWSRLNLAWHFDHSFHQSCHVLVDFVIRAIQIGGGRRADLLRLQLNHEETKSDEWDWGSLTEWILWREMWRLMTKTSWDNVNENKMFINLQKSWWITRCVSCLNPRCI